ncbi:hypothetical protein LCGC14_2283300 [marine sediment metagenome]|uniref:Uncharacterized protein n=1 Tax=marine sediment metagenome TaxID=412755 RepID=A0A0F9DFU4_9ZZZZ
MKCICGSSANEEIEDLKSKFILLLEARNWRDRALKGYEEEIKGLQNCCYKVGDSNVRLKVDCQTLQERVTALCELWGVSIKNNTGLKAQVTWLENVLRGVCELASRNFSPSSHPSPEAKFQRDPE